MICTSRKAREIEIKSFHAKKTHRHCRKYQFIEHAVRPLEPVLEGAARRGLLIVLDIVTNLEGGSPRGAGEFKSPGFL
jgi:hypothetical protein